MKYTCPKCNNEVSKIYCEIQNGKVVNCKCEKCGKECKTCGGVISGQRRQFCRDKCEYNKK